MKYISTSNINPPPRLVEEITSASKEISQRRDALVVGQFGSSAK